MNNTQLLQFICGVILIAFAYCPKSIKNRLEFRRDLLSLGIHVTLAPIWTVATIAGGVILILKATGHHPLGW